MIRSLFIIALFLSLSLSACTEKPDYKRLSPEEVEILIENGHPELLELACHKYYDSLLNSPQDQWFLLGDKYYEKVRDRFLFYCGECFDRGNRDAACMLKEYYQRKLDSTEPDFPRFILFAKECQGVDAVKDFMENDAIFVAIVSVSQDIAAQVGREPESLPVTIERMQKIVQLLDDCIIYLRHSGENLLICRDRAPILRKTLKKMKRRISNYLDKLKMIEAGYEVPDFSPEDYTILDTPIKTRLSELNYFATELGEQIDNTDRHTLLYIADIINAFKARRDQYLRKYRQELT